MTANPSRVDLHVHSRFSAHATDWLLRKFDFPASTSEPLELYSKLRAAGMDLVTLTDQDSIEGCLEIADQPGVFIGEQVTALFPEDECRIHMLVWGHSESQHEEIQQVRENIYELQQYLVENSLTHAVAHPLQSPDTKFSVAHMQKLVLLFRHFETVNGRYHQRLGQWVEYALSRLTADRIAHFAEATGIAPTHEEAWKKVFVGGSDDHGGVALGRAWTEAEGPPDPASFLERVRGGNCVACGKGGNPIIMAHGDYQTAYTYIKKRFSLTPNSPGIDLIEKAFTRFMEGRDPTEFTLGEKLGFVVQGLATGKIFEMALAGSSTPFRELSTYFSKPEVKKALAEETSGVSEPERRAFLMANLIANQLGYRLFDQCIRQVSSGRIIESIQTVSTLVPVAALLSPYIHAFRLPKREFLQQLVVETAGELPADLQNTKRAWFTDTLDDVNGVATTIRKMTAAGHAGGYDVRVMTCRSSAADLGIPIKNFKPVGEFELPEYELQSLSFPPTLHILDHLDSGGYSEVILSTPGPLGLAALLAAKSLGLRTVGIYHTDFPQYVRILTGDSFMETGTWDYMHWFYGQLDLVYVNSEDYRKSWLERGIPAEKLAILPRGLDTDMFSAKRADPAFWRNRGLNDGEVGILYVGRVSKEKNLDLYATVLERLKARGHKVRPLVVGDGPYASVMKDKLPDGIFTGYLQGEELAAAYASADLFLFPSTTDTFGNVILEAQACGLPTIVSDIGGPRDLVRHGVDGFITKALDLSDLTEATAKLLTNPSLRESMGRAATNRVQSRNWQSAFEKFWNGPA